MASTTRLCLLAALAALSHPQPADAGTYRVLYSFQGGSDGAFPQSGLLKVGNKLYGETFSLGDLSCHVTGADGCGTVFSIDLDTGVETPLHLFHGGSDGANPSSKLVVLDGKLYGTTEYGGIAGRGTVFTIDLKTGAEKVLYSFEGPAVARGGALHGSEPNAGLTAYAGMLYGTTGFGGAHDEGTVFSIDPQTGVEQVIHSFDGYTDGAFPLAELVPVGGTLYGTTRGFYGTGSVFGIRPNTGKETTVTVFKDDSGPSVPVTDSAGLLYTTIYSEGGGTGGVLLSIDRRTHAESVIHFFTGNGDGFGPDSNVIPIGNKLWGTTSAGGTGACTIEAEGCGTIYAVNPKNHTDTIVYNFQGQGDAASPAGDLLYTGGTLYGVTTYGGTGQCGRDQGCGTIFAYTP